MKPIVAVVAAVTLSLPASFARASTGSGPAAAQEGRAQTAPPGWAEIRSKALDLTIAGKDDEVLALYEQWVSRHPDFADGHFRLGAAHESVGRGLIASRAADARARYVRHLEAADAHMRRGLEMAGADASFSMLRGLIDLHNVIGLDRPAEFERLVREGVRRYPADPLAHGYLLAVLATKGEPIEAAARAARAAIPAGPDARVTLAGALVAHTAGLGRLTAGLAPVLLPEASRLVDEALALKPGHARALRVRGNIEAAQAMARRP
jgi:hypothetical protein